MKSFCLKTNNDQILDYLLNRIKEIDFEDLVYSQNQFKIYKNIIIHYIGNDNSKFQNFLDGLIKETIIEFYEEKLMKQLINYNYFYFDEYEKKKILENCMQIIDPEIYIEKLSEKNNIKKYIRENNSMIIDGFVYFRLKKYLEYLDEVVDNAVNKFIIEKEYREFISLLRVYIESRASKYTLLHLIYINGESVLLDEKRNIVSVSENIYNAKYLSDISFSSNDFALNTLLCLLPQKLEIHLIDKEDEFINTLKLIFQDRVFICKECDICKTYRLLNDTKISHNQ